MNCEELVVELTRIKDELDDVRVEYGGRWNNDSITPYLPSERVCKSYQHFVLS